MMLHASYRWTRPALDPRMSLVCASVRFIGRKPNQGETGT